MEICRNTIMVDLIEYPRAFMYTIAYTIYDVPMFKF